MLASSIICRRGWTHFDDCLKERLDLAVKDLPRTELVEINLHPRILCRAARNGLKEVRWTIKAWSAPVLINLGWFLRHIVLAHNGSLERKEKLLLRLRRDERGTIGKHGERVGVTLEAEVNPDTMNVKGKVFRLVGDRQKNGWRQTSYMCMDDEWRSLLNDPETPFERAGQR